MIWFSPGYNSKAGEYGYISGKAGQQESCLSLTISLIKTPLNSKFEWKNEQPKQVQFSPGQEDFINAFWNSK